MAILAIQMILVVALTGQLVYGQNCTETQIGELALNLPVACQTNLGTLQALRLRAQADISAGTLGVSVTAAEDAALAAACTESCVGSYVDLVADQCSQEDAYGVALLCSFRPDNVFCVQVVNYVLARVNEAVMTCGNASCPDGCSELLTALNGNGGCCVITRLPFIEAYDDIIVDFQGRYSRCGRTDSQCENNFSAGTTATTTTDAGTTATTTTDAGTTVFIAKTLLAVTFFIATFLNIV